MQSRQEADPMPSASRGESDREFLLQGAALQDSLLQSYRATHVTMQSILLAIGVGLAVIPFSIPHSEYAALAAFVSGSFLVIIWTLHRHAGKALRDVIIERGHDVSYWHGLVISAEQDLPSERRFFTMFKIRQQARRKELKHLAQLVLAGDPISREDATKLIEGGIGHSRRVLDQQLFVGIAGAWYVLLMVGVGATVFRISALVVQ